MKQLLISFCIIIISNLKIDAKINFNDHKNLNFNDNVNKVNEGLEKDSLIFALQSSTTTINYIDIPIILKSKNVITAIDFSFKFNETKLTYDTVFNKYNYLSSLINFNTFDRKLRYTSSSLLKIDTSVTLIVLRFKLTTPCTQISSTDFSVVKTYLNGDPSDNIISYTSKLSSPNADFNTGVLCSKSNIQFTDISSTTTGTIVAWKWDFGNGANSIITNPASTYSATGTYTTSLIVTASDGCKDTIKKSLTIVNVGLTPSLSYSLNCLTDSVYFTNTSSGGSGFLQSSLWDFGALGTSIKNNPTRYYSSGGNYTVSLTSTSNQLCASTKNFVISLDKPILNFSVTSTNQCVNKIQNFNGTATYTSGAITSWNWNFGDGSSSNLQNPSHTYTTGGNYIVKYTVTSNNNCGSSLSKSLTIVKPVVQFDGNRLFGCLTQTVNFNNGSIPSTGSTYIWDFGDGTSSSVQTPSHIYSTVGSYAVKLLIITQGGCRDSLVKPAYISIDNPPNVNFSAQNGCVNSNITFTNSSTTVNGSIGSSFWNFGDGSASTIFSPSHAYASIGVYSIKLVVATLGGCKDSLIKTNYISVINAPNALFTISNTTVTLPNAIVSFTNSSINSTNFLWDYGDSKNSTLPSAEHTFTEAGNLKVCLTAYNTQFCSNTSCIDVLVNYSNLPIAIPLAFTPNADDVNDILKVRGGPLLKMEFKIFNEWGNLLFSSNSQDEGWDGSFNGTEQPVGLYEYTLKGVTVENKNVRLFGVVNLIR
ncbi:MAG: PKD domain-containing protein [Bacteroidota bacterium]